MESTADIYSFLQLEIGDRNPSTATRERLISLIDYAHKEVLLGGGILSSDQSGNQLSHARSWAWLPRTELTFITEPWLTVTVTLSEDSASGSFSAAVAASKAGWFLDVEGARYKIASHTGGATAFTLDGNFISASGTFSATLYKLDYDLGVTDILRYIDEPHLIAPEVRELGFVTADRLSSLEQYREVKKSPLMTLTILPDNVLRVGQIQNKKQKVMISYLAKPDTLDLISVDPIIPVEFRKILMHLAAYYHLVKRDDSRALSNLQNAKILWDLMNTSDKKPSQGYSNLNYGKVVFDHSRAFSGRRRRK